MRSLVSSPGGSLAAAVCTLLCAPAGAAAAEALPDLVSVPPVEQELFVTDGRLLLRFDGFLRNDGAGALELRGGNPQNGVLTDVRQRVYDENGATVAREVAIPALVRYENHVDHSHFHLQAAARYSLWTEDRLWEVIGSEKAGFCLTDSFRADQASGPPVAVYNTGCSRENAAPADPVVMGISRGWRDDYPWTLAYQWLDVSNLRPGRYRLGADVDPDNLVIESNEVNATAFQERVSIVPGYVPLGQNPGVVNPFRPVRINLRMESFARDDRSTLGPPTFAITRLPRCGDATVELADLVYTPGPRCHGSVSIEFSARDSSSPFPTTAPSATVRLQIGTRRALQRTTASRRGRRLRVRMLSRYAGGLRATARGRGRWLGSCTALAPADRRVACSILLPRGQRGAIRVETTLRSGRRVVARRRDRLG